MSGFIIGDDRDLARLKVPDAGIYSLGPLYRRVFGQMVHVEQVTHVAISGRR
jgi:hypothetical protein